MIHPTRRHLLQLGGAGLFGLSLPGLLAASERGSGYTAPWTGMLTFP